MNMTRICVCCGLLLSWAFPSPAAAQEPNSVSEPGFASTSPNYVGYNWMDPFEQTRFQLRSDIGSGLGYANGYQTFAAFQPISIIPEESIFFFSPRGIITYDGTTAANLGGGFRIYNPSTDRIFGAGFWYDHDDSTNFKYDQLGLSFESLGKYLDFRANVYIPTNQHRNVISQTLSSQALYTGSTVSLARSSLTEKALPGGDFEVGGLLPYIGDVGIRTYVGGYYLDGSARGAAYGVKVRGEALVTRDVWASVGYTDDKLFGATVTGAITVFLPGARPVEFFSRPPTQSRLYYQMERNYRMAIHREIIRDNVFPINPLTGLPFAVLHVNNLAAPGGDGTAERPLNFLPTATAPNVDIIDVARGDATVRNMDQGITLQNNQRLLGEGLQYSISTAQGVFALPSNPSGLFPSITNVNGNIVTLASNNEVSGFNMLAAPGAGITASGINGFNIHNVNITNNAAGIQLFNASGTGLINNSMITNNTGVGIGIANSGVPPLDLSVNVVNSNSNGTGLALSATGSVINVSSIDNSYSSNTVDGVDLAATGGQINATIINDLVNDNSGQGMSVTANAGQVNLAMTNVSLQRNASNNFFSSIINGSTLNATFTNSLFLQSVAGSGAAFIADNSAITVSTTPGTFFNANAFNGLVASLTNSSTFTGLFDNIGVGNNVAGNGIGIMADNSVASVFVTNGSNILANQLNGIALSGVNNGQLIAVIDSSNIQSNTAGNGVFMNTNSATGNLIIRNNTDVSGNGLSGVHINATNGSQIDSLLTGSTFNNNIGGDGFRLTEDASSAIVTIAGSRFGSVAGGGANRGNGQNGISMTASNASTLQTSITGSFVSANQQAGVLISANGSNVPLVNIVGNTINNNNGGGVLLNASNLSQLSATVQANSILSNGVPAGTGGFGVGLTATNSNAFLLVGGPNRTTDQNNIFNNVGAGVAFVLQDAATGQFTIMNNTITQTRASTFDPSFGGSGIDVRLVASSPLTLATGVLSNSVIEGNFIGTNAAGTALGNAGNGVSVLASDNSTVSNLRIGTVPTVTNPPPFDGNTILNNGGDGINFIRNGGNAVINNVLIGNNDIRTNVNNGVQIVTRGGTPAENGDPNGNDFTINNNRINSNRLNGVRLQVEGNANLNADMSNNLIDGNGLTTQSAGVLVTEFVTNPLNLRNVSGTWVKNSITNNGGNGVSFTGVSGVSFPMNVGQAGVDPTDGRSLGNNISSNGLNGIQFFIAAGTQSITNNVISNNGTAGDVNNSNGVSWNYPTTSQAFGSETATLVGNTISGNAGDGIATQVSSFPIFNRVDAAAGRSIRLRVTALGNQIQNNRGRGVNILNQGIGDTYFKLGDGTLGGANNILANTLEGVYAVNTASTAQLQHVDSNAALDATGNLDTNPNTILDVQSNVIQGNGFGTVPAGLGTHSRANGIFLRVGTANAFDVTVNGNRSFNSNTTGTATGQGTTSGTGIEPLANGRVQARITGNTIQGNQGSDVYIESFVSTGDPVATAGTWDATTFDVTEHQSDPLARLNLVLAGNTGTNLEVQTLVGVGAFYQSAEPDFKSRIVTSTPPGPFPAASAGRRRNATRIQSNGFDVTAPPPGQSFLFPGVGESTFRVEQGFDTVGGGFTAGVDFAIDNEPVPPTFNANGTPFPGPNLFGELPYGWQSVATGTFTFP